MIYTYQACMAGPYHMEHDIPCQDACQVKKNGDIVVAAVADGLGSELHSDVGAAVASQVATEHCAEKIAAGMMKEEVLAVIKESFELAYEAVVTVARSKAEPEEEYPEDEYDCTLCLAVYDGTTLYYGQSGDSGMVARMKDGSYVKVTEQQRDGWGRVFSLCFGEDEWMIDQLEGEVDAVMLMTDGVWEELCMEGAPDVNEELAKQFLDFGEITEEERSQLEEKANEYLKHYPRNLIDDDKTVVVLFREPDASKTTGRNAKDRTSSIYDALCNMVAKWLNRAFDLKSEVMKKEEVLK